MRKVIYIFIIIMLVGCNSNELVKISKEELDGYLSENGIVPIKTQEIYDTKTMILYEDDTFYKYFELYKYNGEVHSHGQLSVKKNVDTKGIKIRKLGGVASGDFPYALFQIVDDKYINNKYVIHVVNVSNNSSKDIPINNEFIFVETCNLNEDGYLMYIVNSETEKIIDIVD